MWEQDHKEGQVPKKWRLWTVVLEETLESPLDCKEIQPVNPKGNQSWIFIGRTDAEAEALILWPPDAKSRLTGTDPDAGKNRMQKEMGAAEGEMVRQIASLIQWTWIWPTPGNNRGQCHSLLGLQRVGHDLLATEQQQLTFKSLNYFEFIFAYSVRECSDFTDLHEAVQLCQHLLKRPSFLHCIF